MIIINQYIVIIVIIFMQGIYNHILTQRVFLGYIVLQLFYRYNSWYS
jgi:hypothetical protein